MNIDGPDIQVRIGRATKKRKRVIKMWFINRIVDDGEINIKIR